MGVSAVGDRPGRKAHHDLAVVDDAATLQAQQGRRPWGKPAYVVVQVGTFLTYDHQWRRSTPMFGRGRPPSG